MSDVLCLNATSRSSLEALTFHPRKPDVHNTSQERHLIDGTNSWAGTVSANRLLAAKPRNDSKGNNKRGGK